MSGPAAPPSSSPTACVVASLAAASSSPTAMVVASCAGPPSSSPTACVVASLAAASSSPTAIVVASPTSGAPSSSPKARDVAPSLSFFWSPTINHGGVFLAAVAAGGRAYWNSPRRGASRRSAAIC